MIFCFARMAKRARAAYESEKCCTGAVYVETHFRSRTCAKVGGAYFAALEFSERSLLLRDGQGLLLPQSRSHV